MFLFCLSFPFASQQKVPGNSRQTTCGHTKTLSHSTPWRWIYLETKRRNSVTWNSRKRERWKVPLPKKTRVCNQLHGRSYPWQIISYHMNGQLQTSCLLTYWPTKYISCGREQQGKMPLPCKTPRRGEKVGDEKTGGGCGVQ